MIRALIDTHCWLWWLTEPERLRPEVGALITDPRNRILLSAASVWEMTIKEKIGKLELPEPAAKFIPACLARYGFSSLEITALHALGTSDFPLHHRDPFDRLLIAQSRMERIPIITADAVFRQYDVECIWATK